jgi:ribonuclease HII
MHLGHRLVAGTDEAGRGPLAGPVVAAAVILDPADIPDGLNDSKKLSPATRETLYEAILDAGEVAVAVAGPDRVDRMNILAASLWAMERAVAGLASRPDAALIDGRDVPVRLAAIGQAVIGGDRRSVSIAAASIVAKVVRDRMMRSLGSRYPVYGFERHMGYGTRDHLTALAAHGPCPHHRRSFAPVRACLTGAASVAELEAVLL